jgi:hypothetical protein
MSASKSKGSELERMVRAILRDLQSRGLCYLWKLPTDLRLTRNGLMPGDPMPADFMGWRIDGRAILLECKDVDRGSLPLGKAPGMTPFQLQAANMAQCSNAEYLLLWKRGEEFVIMHLSGDIVGEDVISIPWKELPRNNVFPMASLPQVLESSIMSKHETPLPSSSPAAHVPRRVRHRSTNRRAGPPPAPR